jgi:hypothetical protein
MDGMLPSGTDIPHSALRIPQSVAPLPIPGITVNYPESSGTTQRVCDRRSNVPLNFWLDLVRLGLTWFDRERCLTATLDIRLGTGTPFICQRSLVPNSRNYPPFWPPALRAVRRSSPPAKAGLPTPKNIRFHCPMSNGPGYIQISLMYCTRTGLFNMRTFL